MNNSNMITLTTRGKVIESLCFWNYNIHKATAFNISRDTGLSESSVVKTLRILKEDTIVRKSPGGSYLLIDPDIHKKELEKDVI